MHGLSVLHWNAAGVKPKADEFRDFLNSQSPDILCIQETKMSEKSENVKLTNYSPPIRLDSRTTGLTLYVKNTLAYRPVNINTEEFESIAVDIYSSDTKVTIVNIYLSPSKSITLESLTKLTNEIQSENVIICGD